MNSLGGTMNGKLFASVSGVCIATAVVAGGVLAGVTHADAPRQKPAGNQVAVTAPATVTATVTAPASAVAPTVAAKVSPLKNQPAAPKRKAAIVNPGDPVTDPQPTDAPPPAAPTTSSPREQTIDNGSGTVDEGGVRRAPAPSEKVHSVSQPPPPPLGPGAPGSH